MNSLEKAKLLIRVAKGSINEADRQAVLTWADELLEEKIPEMTRLKETVIDFPIPIFRRYKGKRIDAFLLKGGKVELDGVYYPSVSKAAGAVSGKSENGWLVWRYLDVTNNREKPIDDIRNMR